MDPVTVWRWDQALAGGRGGRAGPGPAGPEGGLEADARSWRRGSPGWTRRGRRCGEIAAATGVSTFSVRNALGRVAARGRARRPGPPRAAPAWSRGTMNSGPGAAVPVLPDPVPRDGERALARWGLLGEGAEPVFTPGARYPLAGLLLALPALEAHRAAGGAPGRSTAGSRTGSTGWPPRC